MNIYDPKSIKDLFNRPVEKGEIEEWLSQDDALDFIENEIYDDYIIIYASLTTLFLHNIFIPQVDLIQQASNDLLNWSLNPYDQWGYVVSEENVWIEGPLSHAGSKLISKGEQIIFARSFEGVSSRKLYFELNQKLSQVLGLHYMPELNSWCRLDASGDVWEVIKVLELDDLNGPFSNSIIYGNRELLGEYATVNNYFLLRMFDITRTADGFFGWQGEKASFDLSENSNLFGKLTIVDGDGSYSRGIQVVDISVPKQNIIDSVFGHASQKKKKYETFIAQDWKNQQIREVSCDPDCLASYFVESELPFETSPVFFHPEVLLKYKSDRDKYTLNEYDISCRGVWYLQKYGRNRAGQIFTYICYLGNLPYKEQLHWKQYNESPKAPISEKALKQDFKAEWYDEYEPLQSVKQKLKDLQQKDVDWWKLRSDDLFEKTQYPYSDSKDEWEDELLNLHQLIVEGFSARWLRKKAKEFGRNPDARLGSLKLLEECLLGFGFEEKHAYGTMTPFHILNDLRVKLKGHASGTEALELQKKALTDFGSYFSHYSNLCKECDESLDLIISAFNNE